MTVATRLAVFGVATVAAFGGGAALGAVAGPAPSSTPARHAGHGTPGAASGYRIVADTPDIAAGKAERFTFRVVGPDGRTATAFRNSYARPSHFVAVSNDLGVYAHLRPQLGTRGTWSVDLPVLAPGGYRVFVDTAVSGRPDVVLTTDLVVPGVPTGITPLPAPVRSVAVADLTVDLHVVPAGRGATASFTVRRAGHAVELDPYLGARGHLVAFAAADLAYLHVHPRTTTDAGTVSFTIAPRDPGRYRLFFDFSVDGRVRTASFTVDLGAGAR